MKDEEMRSPIVGRLITLAMFIYASVLNSPLFISIMLGFITSVFIVFLLETNDKDLMETAMTKEISGNIIQKYSEILCFGFAVFTVVTIITYNAITNILI